MIEMFVVPHAIEIYRCMM